MKKFLIICVIVVILTILYFSVPVFHGTPCDEIMSCADDEYHWYKLKYTVSTSVSWYVETSSDKQCEKEYVVVETLVDPRFSEANENFSLDYQGYIFVKSDEKKEVSVDGEKYWCIEADDIEVYVPGETKRSYTLSDMTIEGIIKMICGIFYEPARYSL